MAELPRTAKDMANNEAFSAKLPKAARVHRPAMTHAMTLPTVCGRPWVPFCRCPLSVVGVRCRLSVVGCPVSDVHGRTVGGPGAEVHSHLGTV